MKTIRNSLKIAVGLAVGLSSGIASAKGVMCALPEKDIDVCFSGKFRPEMFWGENLSLFNSEINSDKLYYWRHILDLDFDLQYGKYTHKRNVGEVKLEIRNKGVWGDPSSIAATTEGEHRIDDAIVGAHRHYLPRHILWIREGWLSFDLSEAFSLCFTHKHSLTLGLFPFELGRGIALGSAYAVGPELLGFWTELNIDQFAPGLKLSGDFVTDRLSYDVYYEIVANKCASLRQTGENIYGQEFGRRECPERGFGVINYIVAARLMWTVFNNKEQGKLTFEPYALFNDDPEQRILFLGDANAKLGTFGLAGEYDGEHFMGGFDYAINVGSQKVKGWDRNQIEVQDRNGRLEFVNSQVFLNIDPNDPANDGKRIPAIYKAPHTPMTVNAAHQNTSSTVGEKAQTVVNDAAQNAIYNGNFIGNVAGLTDTTDAPLWTGHEDLKDNLYNSRVRYVNPYTNTYRGWMFVTDAAYWICPKEFFVAGTAGIASGDENPNNERRDGEYQGFIGLQEIYSGKLVRSAFVLGGAGKLHRPLSVPTVEEAPSRFSSEVNGFTNLVFTGASLNWKPQGWKKKFVCNPNVLAYWQQFRTKKFDIATGRNSDEDARTFLGVEVNLFLDYYFLECLKAYFVGSIFIPGGHYEDIAGKPLNAAQERILNRYNRTGTQPTHVPNIGSDVAGTFNIGLEFNF